MPLFYIAILIFYYPQQDDFFCGAKTKSKSWPIILARVLSKLWASVFDLIHLFIVLLLRTALDKLL